MRRGFQLGDVQKFPTELPRIGNGIGEGLPWPLSMCLRRVVAQQPSLPQGGGSVLSGEQGGVPSLRFPRLSVGAGLCPAQRPLLSHPAHGCEPDVRSADGRSGALPSAESGKSEATSERPGQAL